MIEGPVAVTGADGFIGRRVVDVLVGQAEVIRVVGPEGAAVGRQPVRRADLTDREATREALEGASAVVHLAARAGGIQVQERAGLDLYHDNVTMTRNVLRAAASGSCRRVFLASSAVVYSSTASEHPLTEEAAKIAPGSDRITPYAWGKLTDEQLGRWCARSGDIEVVTGRFANVYGPGTTFDPSRSTVVQALARKAVEAGPDGVVEVWGTGRAERSFVYVDDAARAVMRILTAGEPGRAYNVSSSGSVTIAELARRLAAVVSPQLRLRFLPDKPEGLRRRVLDEAALRALGFEPQVSFDAGLRGVVQAYRDQVRGQGPDL